MEMNLPCLQQTPLHFVWDLSQYHSAYVKLYFFKELYVLKYFKMKILFCSDIANPAYDSSIWSLRPEDYCKPKDIMTV